MRILAIDPGNVESAYVVIGANRQPIQFDKVRNDELLNWLESTCLNAEAVVIEMVASYGMAVGADVFETCVWTGRFYQALASRALEPSLIKRLPVKTHHCHSAKATDTNIRQALVDRFALGQPNHGKGTKREPGWFYGFRSDVWAAYALAVYAADLAEETANG